ncbi:hypothetical protein ILUMI_11528 [Ignelater luminosus]|uniref:RING-type E3 ubiquitin transferase n=1 Tax=Ignelater luminosus TaxID=2038154 RepID=A0A8K0D1Z7_IGNLU|nr:hypothetical protein ILUMI_11528 [Ignelater luminosus]
MGKKTKISKQPFTCPSLQNCKWRGTKEELCLHTQFLHCESFTNQNYFSLYAPNAVNYQRNIVLKHYKSIFLLQFKSNVQSEKFWCGVNYIGENRHPQGFYYCVIFFNEDIGKSICKYGEVLESKSKWDFNVNSMLELYLNEAKTKTKNFNILFCIYRYKKWNVINLNREVIRNELKCCVCSKDDIIKQPVFLCLVGHVICYNCIVKSEKKMNWYSCNYGRCNFRAQQISVNLQNFCSNRKSGCFFIGSEKQVWRHELVCPKTITCFSIGCEWKGGNKDFWEHLLLTHPDNTTRNEEVVNYRLDKSPYIFTKFMLCNQELFKIEVEHQKTVMKWTFCWIQWKRSNSSQYYKLILRFFCLDKNSRAVEELELIRYQKRKKRTIVVPFTLLKSYFKGNLIVFSYSILKC